MEKDTKHRLPKNRSAPRALSEQFGQISMLRGPESAVAVPEAIIQQHRQGVGLRMLTQPDFFSRRKPMLRPRRAALARARRF